MSQHCCDVSTLNLNVLKLSVNVVAPDIMTLLVRCRDIELVSPPWLLWSHVVTLPVSHVVDVATLH